MTCTNAPGLPRGTHQGPSSAAVSAGVPLRQSGCESVRDQIGVCVMTVTRGFTAGEIREFVHEYHLQPHGKKAGWLAAQGVSYYQLRRWREAVFDGDVERGLEPRHSSHVKTPAPKRTAFERARAAERAAQEAEVERLNARIWQLEQANEALGKAIGLLHEMHGDEPDETPTTQPPTTS